MSTTSDTNRTLLGAGVYGKVYITEGTTRVMLELPTTIPNDVQVQVVSPNSKMKVGFSNTVRPLGLSSAELDSLFTPSETKTGAVLPPVVTTLPSRFQVGDGNLFEKTIEGLKGTAYLIVTEFSLDGSSKLLDVVERFKNSKITFLHIEIGKAPGLNPLHGGKPSFLVTQDMRNIWDGDQTDELQELLLHHIMS